MGADSQVQVETEGDGGGDDAPVRGTNGHAKPQLTRDQILARDRAAFMAEDGDAGGEGNDGGTVAKPKKPAKPVVDDDEDLDDDADDAEVEDDAKDETADDDHEDDESDQDDDSDLDDDKEEKPDADTAKRLEKIRRTEQRSRDQITKLQADFARERDSFIAEWKPKVEAAEKFEALKAQVKSNTVGVLLELGMTKEDFEFASHELYAESNAKGADDPKRRAAIAASKRERELASEVAKLKKRDEERDERETSTAQLQREQAQLDAYVEDVAKAASDKLPLSKKYLEANPKKARAKLVELANELTIATGSAPEPRDVMKALEKDRRRVLRELGIDPKTLTPAQVAAAANGTLKKKDANGNVITVPKKAAAGDADKPLSFIEQRKRDRDAFIAGEDDADN